MASKVVTELLKGAAAEGTLSGASVQALTVVDIGAQIQAGLGINVDDVTASEVVLVSVLIDDSGSIRFAGNTQVVRDGYNDLIVDALAETKQKDGILIGARYLNGFILNPYMSIDQAVKMNAQNYDPNGGTPLYDQTLVLLGTVMAKSQEFANNGVPVRTITLVITDGADAHSRKATPDTVKTVVNDMLKGENNIIAALGIDDGGQTDFRQVFREMGLRDEWILTPGSSKSEVRKALQLFSRSAVRASQSAKAFSQAAIGGFGG